MAPPGPAADEAEWSAPSYAPLTSTGYPQPPPPPRLLAGLGTITQLLLTAQLLAAIGLLFPVLHQRRLIDRAGDHPGSVSRSAALSADHAVAAFADAVTGLFLVTGLVWLVWFFRARTNVTAWSPAYERYHPHWAVWSWICPVVSLWFPYLITRDVLDDTEHRPSTAHLTRPARPLLLGWWIGYALLQLLWVIEQSLQRSGSVTGLGLHSDLEVATVVVRIVSASLAIAVVRRLTTAQTERIENTVTSGRALVAG